MKNVRVQAKRILAILLTVLLVVLVLPVALALDDSGSCGPDVKWRFNSSTGVLTISGTGEMYDYGYNDAGTTINAPWQGEFWSKIKTIILEEGITSIGENAFHSCTGISTIKIPNSVQTIRESAFSFCDNLVSVTFGLGLTTIDMFAFSNCSSLVSIVLPDSLITVGESSFAYCSSLKSVHIGDNVTDIGRFAFEDCAVSNLYIGKNVLNIGAKAFFDCDISELTLGENVETIGSGAFLCCRLKSVTMSNKVSVVGTEAFGAQYEGYSLSGNQVIEDVFFVGTQEDWNRISFGDENEQLLNAQLHFVKPHAHFFLSTPTTLATCTAPGIMTYTCSCGDTYTEEIPIDPTNHAVLDENGDCPRCGKHVKDVEKPIEPATQPSEEKPHENLNFFQRIIQWFRNLFAKLFGR